MRSAALFMIALLTAGCTLSDEEVLETINSARRASGSAVFEKRSPNLDEGALRHALYIANTSPCNKKVDPLCSHKEDPRNPWYSAEGAAAGQRGVIYIAYGTTYFPGWKAAQELLFGVHGTGGIASDGTEQAGPLDPRATAIGIGHATSSLPLRTIWVVDTGNGGLLDSKEISWPKAFPSDQQCLPTSLVHDQEELPVDPAELCGYTLPTSSTLTLFLGPGSTLIASGVTAEITLPGGEVIRYPQPTCWLQQRSRVGAYSIILPHPLAASETPDFEGRTIRYQWYRKWMDGEKKIHEELSTFTVSDHCF